MKVIVVFALISLAAANVEYYTTADDNLNMEEVVAEIERLQRYVDCFLDRAPCSERTASYKKIIPESLMTKCEKCNDAQKHLAHGFLRGLKAALPEEYISFRLKYDPEDKYFDDFEKAVDGCHQPKTQRMDNAPLGAYRDDSRISKMKWIIVLSALTVLARAKDLYSTENDDLDIDGLVKDVGSLKAFLGCFNDIGTCNAEAADFKKDMAEAVAQACEKCTEAQKHIFKVFLEAIKEKDPEGYKIFQQKYDPQNKYIAALQTAIASY
ncbi:uncharacterized protein LOC120633423 [Pararge aegeria]|uniref:uncharacterized protein LOC120633423 n=1 Tax=Pararge aegeria TaxID=116150 RepID=UPI0019D26862|nr:uncharacterized protein LOC120633423 [Pararge aegeria]